jgi:hypothetical protein
MAFLSEMHAPTGDGIRDSRTEKISAFPLNAIDVSNGSRFLATGSSDGTLAVWDMKSRSIESRFKEGASIAAVSFQRTSDSRYVACARESGISLYSRISGRLVNQFQVSTPPEAKSGSLLVTAMAFSPILTNVLVAADNYGAVTVWDISRVKPLAPGITTSDSSSLDAPVLVRFPSPENCMPASDIAFCPKPGPFSFGVSYLDKRIAFFSIESRKMTHVISCPSPLTSLAIALDANTIAAGSATGSIYMYRLTYLGSRLSHKVILTIESAHKSASLHDFPTSTAAVRSLHFQPTLDSPSRVGFRSKSARAPGPAPESIKTASHSARVDETTDEKTESRESALFSPLPKVAPSKYPREFAAPRFRVSRESDIIPVRAQVEKPLQSDSAPKLEAHAGEVAHENTLSDGALSFNSIQSLSSDVEPSEHDEVDAALSEIPPGPAGVLGGYDLKGDGTKSKKDEMADMIGLHRPPVGQLNRSSSEGTQGVPRDIGVQPARSFSAGAKRQGLDEQGIVMSSECVTKGASPPSGSAHLTSDEEPPAGVMHDQGPVGVRRPPAGRMNRSTSELEHGQKGEDLFPRRSLSASDKPTTRARPSAPRAGRDDSSGRPNSLYGEFMEKADSPDAENEGGYADFKNTALKTPHGGVSLQAAGPEFPDHSIQLSSGEVAIPVEGHDGDKASVRRVDPPSGLMESPLEHTGGDPAIHSNSESLTENMRQLFRQEMNVFREDVRSDLLNLHRELVLSFAHQEEHFQEMLARRDKKLEVLEQQLKDLREENKRKVSVGEANLSDWM